MSLAMYGPTPKDSDSIVEAIGSGDLTLGAQAVEALTKSPRSVARTVARSLAVQLQMGHRASAICAFLRRPDAPRFDRRGTDAIFAALAATRDARLLPEGEITATLNAFTRSSLVADTERGPRTRGDLRQLLSVFTRAWVLAVCLLLVLVLVGLALDGRFLLALLLAAFAVGLFIAIDGATRQCPSCRKFLGGELMRVEADGSYTSTERDDQGNEINRRWNTHKRTWRCIRCDHEWTT
jgi:hypothetical protein